MRSYINLRLLTVGLLVYTAK